MKNILLICSCALVLSGVSTLTIAESTSQLPGMMNGQHSMQGQRKNMGMMSKHNCMGMMRGRNKMGMMNNSNQMGMMKGECMNMSMQRHRFVMQNGINSTYQNKVNPIQSNAPEILNTGKALYDKNCAACHGQKGLGDGPAGVNLTPKPANIAAFSKMPMASDSYLNWTISEGGIPVGSSMPAFKSQLNEQEIWQIITYLRSF